MPMTRAGSDPAQKKAIGCEVECAGSSDPMCVAVCLGSCPAPVADSGSGGWMWILAAVVGYYVGKGQAR